MATGLFITLEGIEGAGKTTQVDFIAEFFTQKGNDVTLTREPGGTKMGEAIRAILLDSSNLHIDSMTELLLIFTARAQHLQEIISPALGKGHTVICDRFTDATYAYQCGGRGISYKEISILEALIQRGLKPDLTLLFDVPVDVGLIRATSRSKADRFEGEASEFFEKVRLAYLGIAKTEPDRFKIINANQAVTEIQKEITTILEYYD